MEDCPRPCDRQYHGSKGQIKFETYGIVFVEISFFFDLPAFRDHAPDCTQTSGPYQRSWHPAWCRQHRKWLWYEHSLHYDDKFWLITSLFINQGHTVGQAISEHPLIEKVAFTGSTLTGRKILKASSESNLKVVSLELGGKSPCVVFDDANLDQATKWASIGILYVFRLVYFNMTLILFYFSN